MCRMSHPWLFSHALSSMSTSSSSLTYSTTQREYSVHPAPIDQQPHRKTRIYLISIFHMLIYAFVFENRESLLSICSKRLSCESCGQLTILSTRAPQTMLACPSGMDIVILTMFVLSSTGTVGQTHYQKSYIG